MIPHKIMEAGQQRELEQMIPEHHRQFVEQVLAKHGVAELDAGGACRSQAGCTTKLLVRSRSLLGIRSSSLRTPWGAPPPEVIAQARALGIKPLRSPASPSMRSATGTPGSIMSWRKVTRQGDTAAR